MSILPTGDGAAFRAAPEPRQVRIVSTGPTGFETRVEGLDGSKVARIEIQPIKPDGLIIARLDVVVDELDIQAELDQSTPPAASVAAQLAVDVARLQVRPGDVVVVTMREALQAKQRAALRSEVASVVPNGARVLVLDGGMGLAVLAPDQVPAGAVEPCC